MCRHNRYFHAYERVRICGAFTSTGIGSSTRLRFFAFLFATHWILYLPLSDHVSLVLSAVGLLRFFSLRRFCYEDLIM